MYTSHLSTDFAYSGFKDRRVARGRIGSIGAGYPALYVEIEYRVNSKTGLVNPATKDNDVKIRCAPYGWGLSDAFNAPAHGVQKTLNGPILTFSFVYNVQIGGTVHVEGGVPDIVKVETDIKPYRAMVEIYGDLNTVTGDGSFGARKL